MIVFVNRLKHFEFKNGSFLKPLIGININATSNKINIEAVYHSRIQSYRDGSVLTIILGWMSPKIAFFFMPFFPFVSVTRSFTAEDEELVSDTQ